MCRYLVMLAIRLQKGVRSQDNKHVVDRESCRSSSTLTNHRRLLDRMNRPLPQLLAHLQLYSALCTYQHRDPSHPSPTPQVGGSFEGPSRPWLVYICQTE